MGGGQYGGGPDYYGGGPGYYEGGPGYYEGGPGYYGGRGRGGGKFLKFHFRLRYILRLNFLQASDESTIEAVALEVPVTVQVTAQGKS